MKLGNFLRNERRERKLTMRTLGEKVGISPVTISDLENGKRISINGEALKKLAVFYNVDHPFLQNLALEDKVNNETKSPKSRREMLLKVARYGKNEDKFIDEKLLEILKYLNQEGE